MRHVQTSAVVALALVGGCVSQSPAPEYSGDYYAGLSTGPGDESYYGESSWSGPPGGAIDPGYGYADPSLAQVPSTDGGDPNATVYGGAMYGGNAYGDPWAGPASGGDPATWAGATSEVTDAEIDVTLEAYGEWVEDPDYGRVWRPYTTVVGADFTPYETCGSWVFTDYGWTFQSCDEWSWGWLPFHYGRWVYLDNSWCWSRDYTWGPGWVEWRHGGGYVGWRPLRPTRQIRDHRDRHSGPLIRDHRRGKHAEWRFQSTDGFGRGRIRPSRSIGINEGLRATTAVAQPPLRGDVRNRVGTVMAGRLRDHQRFETRTRGTIGQSTRGYQPTRGYNNVGTLAPRGGSTNVGTRGYNPTYNPNVVGPSTNRPTWQRHRADRFNAPANRAPVQGYRNNAPASSGYRAPTQGDRYNPPASSGYNRAPVQGYRNPPANTYRPPTQGYRNNPPTNTRYNAPVNRAPSQGYRYNAPSRPSPAQGYRYNAPSRPSPSWGGSRPAAPSRSSSPPSRSSAPSRSYSPPSRSSAPSRNYSAPSRSSSSPSRSYSSPSRSSSSYSSPSRSSSSSSRGSSSSSSSSSRSSGGGRGRR